MTDLNRRRRDLSEAIAALGRAADVLADVEVDDLSEDYWLATRARLGVQLAAFDRAVNRLSDFLGLSSARTRLERFLRDNVGRVVEKDELRGVAGIHEWARRVRELRVEHGWHIDSHEALPQLSPGQYVLSAGQPDLDKAGAWAIANRIRRLTVGGRPASAKARLLAFLQAVYPQKASKDDLTYVSYGVKESARRIRELSEEGWQIVSNVDDPTLAPGEYRLAAVDRLPPRAREAIKLRHLVFERDGKRCVDCGRTPEADKVQLQAHHVVLVSEGGTNDLANLVTLCADCHAGRHALHRSEVHDELLQPPS